MLPQTVNVPRVVDLFVPTVQALQKLGGSASIEEIDEKIVELINLSDGARTVLHNNGPRTKFQYRCAWARSWLKHADLTTNSERGVWTLTFSGDLITEEDFASLPTRVRQAVYAIRRGRQIEKTEQEDGDQEEA